ncbi:hypothetical protein P8452_09395 [Trifolium repens]|jgi:hypothetical protein|nr:hypothetical protein P8452_09395 [Trifolium repens]
MAMHEKKKKTNFTVQITPKPRANRVSVTSSTIPVTTPLTDITNQHSSTQQNSVNSTIHNDSHCHTNPSTSQNIFIKTRQATNCNTVGVNLVNRFAEPTPSSINRRKRKVCELRNEENTLPQEVHEDGNIDLSDNEQDFDNFDEGNSDSSSDDDNVDGLPSAFEGY